MFPASDVESRRRWPRTLYKRLQVVAATAVIGKFPPFASYTDETNPSSVSGLTLSLPELTSANCMRTTSPARTKLTSQANDKSTTPPIMMPHPVSRQGPTRSRRINIPIIAPTIMDISRIGATRLSGAPEVSAINTRM